MKKFAGLKIGTGENEKVLIDEFGAPTKEGLLAAGIGLVSALGTLVIAKDILVMLISRLIRKGKKKLKKARKSRVKLKNKALKQQVKQHSSALKQQVKINKALVKDQEKLVAELNTRPFEPDTWQWKLVKKICSR
ncbi:MAG: hypothetical protein MJ117_02550 [Lachnospiraceae bacterium]|nr:hypothetical protein [Lachnospiraceae bacterium]